VRNLFPLRSFAPHAMSVKWLMFRKETGSHAAPVISNWTGLETIYQFDER